MAVAGDRASRFGSGDERDPRQQAADDEAGVPAVPGGWRRALFGAVVTSQLPAAGDATVTMRSLDPGVLEFDVPSPSRRLPIRANGSIEVALRCGGEGDRPRARPDDGAARQRDRRLRGRHPGRGAGVAGDRGGIRPARGRRRRRPRKPSPFPNGVVPGFGGLSRRDVVDGDGRARRRRALPGRVSVRLRRAARVAGAGAAAGRRPWRGVHAAGHGHGQDASRRAADAQGARAIPVCRRRVCVLAGRL